MRGRAWWVYVLVGVVVVLLLVILLVSVAKFLVLEAKAPLS